MSLTLCGVKESLRNSKFSCGIPVGTSSISMGHNDKCKSCRFSIIEPLTYCFMDCKASRKIWKFFGNIRLNSNKLWHFVEKICFMHYPRIRWGTHYIINHKKIGHIWDVLRSALIWQIWCTRCRNTVVDKDTIVSQNFHMAQSNTIHASMTLTSLVTKNVGFKSAKNNCQLMLILISMCCAR